MANDLVGVNDVIEPESEAEFQARILGCAKTYGFTHRYHNSTASYPEVTLLNPDSGVGVVVKFKRADGKLTPAQRDWLIAFNNCGIDAVLWAPSIEDDIVHWLYSPLGNAPSVDFWSDSE